MRVVGDKEGNGKGGKGNGNRSKDVRGWTAMVTKRAMATAMRVADNKESKGGKSDCDDNEVVGDKEGNGKGSKSNGNAIRMVGKQQGQWQWQW
jgi:hypothetical protein